MKKARLLMTLALMLVAVSVSAQDSYREAVKQYISINSDQLGKFEMALTAFNELFEKDGAVDVNQLTQRFIDERLEDCLVDFTLPMLKAKGMTEADLLEVASLLSTPEGKAFSASQQEWMQAFAIEFMMSAMDLSEEMDSDEPELDPVEVKPGIDAAYAAQFEKVFEKMDLKDQVLKGFSEGAGDERDDNEKEMMLCWLGKNLYAIALNSAYDKLTPEDLNYAEQLYSYESYRKLNDNSEVDLESAKPGAIFTDYLNWMKEQGAKLDENAEGQLSMLKEILGLEF